MSEAEKEKNEIQETPEQAEVSQQLNKMAESEFKEGEERINRALTVKEICQIAISEIINYPDAAKNMMENAIEQWSNTGNLDPLHNFYDSYKNDSLIGWSIIQAIGICQAEDYRWGRGRSRDIRKEVAKEK